MWKSIIAICLGASAGALLRWVLGTRLNSLLPGLPLGTLAANLLGAFVVGAAIAFFATYAALSPEWRLVVITGFCGGLTTFSTFSAEVTMLLRQGRSIVACGVIAAHVGGSLAMTFAGIGVVGWWTARRLATPVHVGTQSALSARPAREHEGPPA